jgi:hypothetical protein
MRDWNWKDPSGGPRAWRQQLEELQAEILTLLEPLDDGQVNWRPEDRVWSIGQCVDHLGRTNAMVLEPLRLALTQGHAKGRIGKEPFRYGPLARWFLRSMSPQPRQRVKTPRKYTPAPEHEVQGLVREFTRVQQEMLVALGDAEGLDLGRVKMRSPALWLLRLPAGIWFAALAAHEARHLQQARGLLHHPAFPRRR